MRSGDLLWGKNIAFLGLRAGLRRAKTVALPLGSDIVCHKLLRRTEADLVRPDIRFSGISVIGLPFGVAQANRLGGLHLVNSEKSTCVRYKEATGNERIV